MILFLSLYTYFYVCVCNITCDFWNSFFYREKITTFPRKEKKREARREEKAEKAAVLEKVIVNPNVIHAH